MVQHSLLCTPTALLKLTLHLARSDAIDAQPGLSSHYIHPTRTYRSGRLGGWTDKPPNGAKTKERLNDFRIKSLSVSKEGSWELHAGGEDWQPVSYYSTPYSLLACAPVRLDRHESTRRLHLTSRRPDSSLTSSALLYNAHSSTILPHRLTLNPTLSLSSSATRAPSFTATMRMKGPSVRASPCRRESTRFRMGIGSCMASSRVRLGGSLSLSGIVGVGEKDGAEQGGSSAMEEGS